MRAADESAFEQFVAARSGDLIRLAVLLAADRGHAYAEVVDPVSARYAEIRSTEPGGRPYLVPRALAGVEVLTADDRVLGLLPLTDGGYVGEVPGGAFVPSTDGAASLRAVDDSGATVAEAPVGRLVTG